MPENSGEKLQIVMNLVMEFSNAYDTSIKGKYTKIKKD